MGLIRAARCFNCGRKVRGLPDARKEGKHWFCSQSCLLQAESAGTRSGRPRRQRSGPIRVLRRMLKWTLILVGLIVALTIGLALAGVGGTNHKRKASPRLVAHAKPKLGSRAKPIPLGRTAAVGGGWQMRVVSVEPNAGKQIAAVAGQYGQPTPANAQDFMLTLSGKYIGGGRAEGGFLGGLNVVGSHKTPYLLTSGLNGCGPGETKLPLPDLQASNFDNVFSGTALRGHVCFQIASNDAQTLILYSEDITYPANSTTTRIHRVWFALR